MLIFGLLLKILELPLILEARRLGKWTGQLLVVDLAFVVWVLIAMENFNPQIRLDASAFIWIADVTEADAPILLVLVLADLLADRTLPKSLRPTMRTSVMGAFVIVAVGGIAGWPAYWFIFCVVVRLLAAATNLLLDRFLHIND